jgi:hypothetical protein
MPPWPPATGSPRSRSPDILPGVPALTQLVVADDPATWERLGFTVAPDGTCRVGAVAVRLAGAGAGRGILSWSLDGAPAAVDGLAAAADEPPRGDSVAHPNGARRLDHVVVATPDVARTFAALAAAGLELRRVREAGSAERPLRQGFYRVGEALLEVVGPPEASGDGPAAFWGLVAVVDDLDALATRLGPQLGRARAAVQAGRRIATLRESAGSSVALAFMTPRTG